MAHLFYFRPRQELMNKDNRFFYHAYLVRCWREENGTLNEARGWRFSVEQIFDERWRRGFANLDALVSFLQAELERSERASLQENRDSAPHDT
jgi:hypothetical protein